MPRTTWREAAKRHGRRLFAIACTLVLVAVPAAHASLGDLDPAFDGDGVATPDVGAAGAGSFEAVATRSDGAPVAAGTDDGGAFVARLTSAGAPGPFGSSGVVRLANGNFVTQLHAVAVDDADAVLAAGNQRASTAPAPGTPFVLRLTPGGGPDGAFTPLGTQVGEARGMAPLDGGPILIGGWLDNGAQPDVFFVARLLDTGALDATFGTRGMATAALGVNAHALALAVGPDGRIVLAGWSEPPSPGPPLRHPAVAIFDSAGNLVDSFTRTDIVGDLRAVRVDGVGRITAAGTGGDSGLAARWLADGTPDGGFGNGGVVTGPAATELNGLALDGARSLVAGSARGALLLGSLDTGGTPEPALGGVPPGWRDFPVPGEALGLALLPGGSIYTAGGPQPFVSRHLPNAAPAAALAGPAQVLAGEAAPFDAGGSNDPEGEQLRYEFDLDGDGAYEFDGGANPLALRSFPSPGIYTVGVRVTDPRGASAAAARTLVVVVPLHNDPPPPILGVQGVGKPISGVVRYKPPGTKTFLPMTDITAIPNGTEIDVRKGRLLLTVLHDASGRLDGAEFYAGRFVFRQGKGATPRTTLKLSGGSFANCVSDVARQAKPGSVMAVASSVIDGTGARSRRRVRRLWGDGRGRFRTRGRYGAATVRGTKWLTVDRCDGTKVRVVRGKVSVQDLVRPNRRSELVKAGQQAFVPSKRGG